MRKLVGIVTATEQEAQPFINGIDDSEYEPASDNIQYKIFDLSCSTKHRHSVGFS